MGEVLLLAKERSMKDEGGAARRLGRGWKLLLAIIAILLVVQVLVGAFVYSSQPQPVTSGTPDAHVASAEPQRLDA